MDTKCTIVGTYAVSRAAPIRCDHVLLFCVARASIQNTKVIHDRKVTTDRTRQRNCIYRYTDTRLLCV